MTSVYPTDEKPNLPPSYEQATHYQQGLPVPSLFDAYSTSATVLQPQAPPFDMYSTSTMIPPPKGSSGGMYSSSAMMPPNQLPPPGMYAISGTVPLTQAPPVGTHMLITTQSLIYGNQPIQCICPHCHQPIVTRVEMTTGLVSWLVCGGILLLGGWLGCCLIPFCADSLKDIEHYCPNCAVLLGTRRRM